MRLSNLCWLGLLFFFPPILLLRNFFPTLEAQQSGQGKNKTRIFLLPCNFAKMLRACAGARRGA